MLYDIAHTTLCLALLAFSVYRAQRVSHRSTLASVRLAIALQAAVALIAAGAPWLLRCAPGALSPWAQQHLPEAVALLLLASMVVIQGVTTMLWRNDVPASFRRACCHVPSPSAGSVAPASVPTSAPHPCPDAAPAPHGA